MARTVIEYRWNEKTETIEEARRVDIAGWDRAGEAKIRRWCREAGHDPEALCYAETEYGLQASIEDDELPSVLWEMLNPTRM